MFQERNSFDEDFEQINIDGDGPVSLKKDDFEEHDQARVVQMPYHRPPVQSVSMAQQNNFLNDTPAPFHSQPPAPPQHPLISNTPHNLPMQYEPGQNKRLNNALPQLSAVSQSVGMVQDLNVKDYQRVSQLNASQAQFGLPPKEESPPKETQPREVPLMQLDGVVSQLQPNDRPAEPENPQQHQRTWNDTEDEEQDKEKDNQTNIPQPMIVDNLQIDDMQSFLTSPLKKGVLLQCTIKRDKSGMMNKLYPKYHVGLSNGFQYLMSARKKSFNKCSNYCISLNQADPAKQDKNFLGKVRSNFMGTEFTIYDKGQNPTKAQQIDQIRKQLGVVVYQTNFMGTKGPRKMQVLLPEVDEYQPMSTFSPVNPKDGILPQFQSGDLKGLKYLLNKTPKWNEKAQAFVLNFKGRVEKPSVKNFQLIDHRDENTIYLQFGRLNNELFNMDFQYPLSPLQAFGICLSSFDNKLACE